ncbi:MAG: DUF6338 family protein [Acidobacteriia bacterium]|nr:DUF6338 family protein [Terriglobia bacterium]
MDRLGYETASIIVVLLPGFISAAIISALCVRPKQSEFEKVIEAVVNTFVVVVVYALVVGKFPLSMEATADQNTTHYQLVIDRLPLLILIVIAIGWSLLVCFCEQRDFPFHFLRRWRFTTRTSRASLWDDAFSTYGPKGYVQVELSDGRCVMGYPKKYSDDTKDVGLFLEDAGWVSEAGDLTRIPGGGILLTKSSGITNITFLNAEIDSSKVEGSS